MRVDTLMEELELCQSDEVFIEINGVQHALHEVQDTSQGVILVVDTDQEEREMR